MDSLKFSRINTVIRVYETRLLTKDFFNSMIAAENYNEAVDVLCSTEYSNYFEKAKNKEDFYSILDIALEEIYREIYKLTPEKGIVDFIALKYDYHNLKVILTERFLEKDLSYARAKLGSINKDKIKNAVETLNFKELSKDMGNAVKLAIKSYEENQNLKNIDVLLDKLMLEEMKTISNKLACTAVSSFLQAVTVINNKKLLIRSGENLEVSEKNLDDYLMDKIKLFKINPFGMESILGFLYAKETEIKNIRIILAGKINNIENNMILERLRQGYEDN